MRHWNKWNVQISGAALLSIALMLLVLPLQWVAAALAAACWHELCHIVAVRLFGGKIGSISVGDSGAVMECGAMKPGREVVCILAGPFGSLLLLLLAKWLPRTALCGLFHGLYNLIPLFPLDGGRALRAAAFALLPYQRAEALCLFAGYAAVLLTFCLTAYGSFALKLGMYPLLVSGVLLFRLKREKLLANCRVRGYNRPNNK